VKISSLLEACIVSLTLLVLPERSLLLTEGSAGDSSSRRIDIPGNCGTVPRLFVIRTSLDQLALGQPKVSTGEELPPAVADKVGDLGLQLWEHFYRVGLERNKESGTSDSECYSKVADVFGNIYRVQYKGPIDVFVADLYGSFGYEEVRLVLFDNATRRVTASPPGIFSRWRMMAKDDSLRGRVLRFEDIDRDGRTEIGALEYTHNGNVYTGQVIHYFSVDDALNLRESLALEVETLTPHIRIQRSTQWVSANSLNLIVRTYNEYDGSGKLIDNKSYRLSRRDRSEPYQLVGKFEKQDPPWIVSGCEETSANDFLAHGCGFRY